MATLTSGKPQTSQGSGAMPASAQTNDGRTTDVTSGKMKIRNFYLGENGQWKLRTEILSQSDLEKYTKKIIWDESVSLKEDKDFARHLLESLEEDLGYRDKFTPQKRAEGDEKTKKEELQRLFPHEAARWETLRDRVASLPYFDRYLIKNPGWSEDERFSSCLMDRLEEQLNNSDDWQNYNNTTLEKDTSRDNANVEKAQEEEEYDSEGIIEDGANEDDDARDDSDDVIDLVDDDDDDEDDDDDDDGDFWDGDDKNDEDWVVDDEDRLSDDDTDTDVVSVCDDPKPPCRRKTRQDSRLVIQHEHVSSSDRDQTEEETEMEEDVTMIEEETEVEEKTVMESKQTMYECKFCREVFRTRFLVTQHYTTKHQRHVYRSMSKECANVLRRCGDCDSYVAGLKQHRLEKHQVCQECGRIYDSVEKLRKHTESHTNPKSDLVRPKQKVFECKNCKENFGTERHATQHFLKKHQNCKTNNSIQKSGTVLQTMKVGECATVLWYCKDCDSYVVDLKSHRQEKHQDCAEVCRKTSASQVLLHRHKAVPTKKTSKRKSLLCHYRGNRCRYKQQFNYPIKRHQGEIQKNHKCDVCCSHFWSLKNLAFHKRFHSNDKTLLCSICGLLFFLKEDIEKHMSVHTGAKSYNV